MQQQRVVLVTGTSSGIGLATRAELQRRGWRVFGSARRPDGADADVLPLDVTDRGSVEAAVATVLERAGRIDAVVNNAGVDIEGAAEETSIDEAKALFDTNFFGVHRMVQEVLPHLRAQGGGRIVVTSSLAAHLPIPFDAFYTASKHALAGYLDALRFEVAPFGVHCTAVEPGFIRTPLRDNKRRVDARLPVYDAARRKAAQAFDRGVERGTAPEAVGRAVAQVLESRRPPTSRRVGTDARLLPALRSVLPRPAFEAGMRRVF